MAFLTMNVQREFFMQNQTAIEYRMLCVNSNLTIVTKASANLADAGADATSPQVVMLKSLEESYKSEVKSLETQLAFVKESLSSIEKQVEKNIKSSCSLSLLS